MSNKEKEVNCAQVDIETNSSYDGSIEDYQLNMVSQNSDSETNETKEPKYLVTKFVNKTYNVMVAQEVW